MPNVLPSRCPFCECYDIRPLATDDGALVGYRCHDCNRVFYTPAVVVPAKIEADKKR